MVRVSTLIIAIAVMLQTTHKASPLRQRSRTVSDSPIQVISIRPAPLKYGRIHRGMPPASDATDKHLSKSERAATVAAAAVVVNIEPLHVTPKTMTKTNKQRPIPMGASKIRSKSKDGQTGKWLRVVNGAEGQSSSMYFARSWANGLFGIGTLRANGKAVKPIGGKTNTKTAALKWNESAGKM